MANGKTTAKTASVISAEAVFLYLIFMNTLVGESEQNMIIQILSKIKLKIC